MKAVVAQAGVSVVVPSAWRRRRSYRAGRRAIEEAQTYSAAVQALRRVAMLDGPSRAAIASDFAPAVTYARRFMNSTVAHCTRPSGDPRRRLGQEAMRLVLQLWGGHACRPGRRPASGHMSPEQATAVWCRVERWRAQLGTCLRAAGGDAAQTVKRLDAGLLIRWDAPKQQMVMALVRRHSRPSQIAIQLTAWELGLSLRQVRSARIARQATVILRYA